MKQVEEILQLPGPISVIIPVYNSYTYLARCLEHLASSTVAPAEMIVVDDGSTDGSPDLARRYGAKLLSTGGRRGPAYARNLGAQAAASPILFFLDADVCVHPDTIERALENFEQDPSLDALIGSYDAQPGSRDFLSLYRNLMHCFVHQQARHIASTFWSGCGAVKRDVFLAHAGFDENLYARPAIEDIELGFRMRRAKRKIVLDRTLQVKHLKRWTFWNLVKTDILDRGIPWTELILRDRNMPNDLNLQLSQRVSVALVFLLVGLAAACAVYKGGLFLTPLFAIAGILLARYWVDESGKPGGAKANAAMTAVLGAISLLAWHYGMAKIIPPLLLAYVLLFLRHRYSYKYERRRKVSGFLWGVYAAVASVFIFTYLPSHPLVLSFFLLLIGIAAINVQFYLFLVRKFGTLCALASIPFHLLYHFYNGISFVVGSARFVWHAVTHRAPAKGAVAPAAK